jgi:O-antigen ligase
MPAALTRVSAVRGPAAVPLGLRGREAFGGTAAVVAVGAVLLIIGAAAFFADPKLGAAMVGLPALPLFVMFPAHALLVFVAALPFDAVAALLPDKTLSLTRLLGVAVLGGWAVWVLMNRVRVRLTGPGYLLASYVGFAAISYFWSDNAEATSNQLRTLVQLFLLYIMTANLMTRLPSVERTLNVLIAGTAVLGLLVVWQFPSGGLDRGTFTYGEESFNPNYLAATLVLPAVAAAALGSARGAFGWWRLAAIIPIAAGIVVSGSRGGIVGFVAGIGVLCLARPRLGMRALGALVLLSVALPFVLPTSMLEHLVTRFTSAGTDRLSGRLDIWKVTFAMIGDRPLHGTGYACFRDAFYQYMATAGVDPRWALANRWGGRASHNVYLGTLAELGVVGLGLLLSAFAAHGLGVLRTWRAAAAWGDYRFAAIALALLCMLASFLVFANSIDFMLRKTPWMMLGMIQGTILAAERSGMGARGR